MKYPSTRLKISVKILRLVVSFLLILLFPHIAHSTWCLRLLPALLDGGAVTARPWTMPGSNNGTLQGGATYVPGEVG